MNSIEFEDGEYAIISTIALFGKGYNCYKKNDDLYTKINDRLSFFNTYEGAKEWLEKYKSTRVGN